MFGISNRRSFNVLPKVRSKLRLGLHTCFNDHVPSSKYISMIKIRHEHEEETTNLAHLIHSLATQ